MTIVNAIAKEILYRKANFVLSVLAAVIAVSLYVFFFTTGEASEQETTRLMRDMGLNLRIIPKETDMSRFWTDGFSLETMPEEYLTILASQRGFSYNHLVGTLQKRILWRNTEVILTGLAPELCPPDRKKAFMLFEIPLGTVYAGFQLVQQFGLKRGETVDILGRTFTLARCLSETGSTDDIRIQCHLRDAQSVLGLEGRINEIQAIDCLCFLPQGDSMDVLRKELASVIPQAKVIQKKSIAMARTQQRVMVNKYRNFIMPFLIVVCATWIGALAMMNVRDRRQEIGILRALGFGSGRIASLFLGKAVLVGLIGAALGFFAGTELALSFGPGIFKVTAQKIEPLYPLLAEAAVAAPLFAALSSFFPAMMAAAQDPAATLRQV